MGYQKVVTFFSKGTPFINYSDIFNNDILPTNVEGVANSHKIQQEIFSVKKEIFL